MVRVLNIIALFLLSTVNYGHAKHLDLDRQIKQATHSLIQGDHTPVRELLSATPKLNKVLSKLKIIHLLQSEKIDATIDSLELLELNYPRDPEVFAFSAEVWRSIGHEVSIFSKRKYYKRAVSAKLNAGALAQNQAEYLTLMASAYGQSKSYGGDKSKQEPITEKIRRLDNKWGYIAHINLAQNQERFEQAISLAKQAVVEFPNDFSILERVAKLYWTLRDYSSSQHFYYKACQNNPQGNWHLQINWLNACWQTAIFTKEKEQNKQYGVNALKILLEEYKLPTQSNYEIYEYLLEIADQGLTEEINEFADRFN